MKKIFFIISILVITLFTLSACSSTLTENIVAYNDSNAISKIGWQYVIGNIPSEITSAEITRLELVDTYQNSQKQNIEVYALEYLFLPINRSVGFLGTQNLVANIYLSQVIMEIQKLFVCKVRQRFLQAVVTMLLQLK